MVEIVKKSKLSETTQLNISGEFKDAIDAAVEEIITKASKRAEANGRKTLKACDL